MMISETLHPTLPPTDVLRWGGVEPEFDSDAAILTDVLHSIVLSGSVSTGLEYEYPFKNEFKNAWFTNAQTGGRNGLPSDRPKNYDDCLKRGREYAEWERDRKRRTAARNRERWAAEDRERSRKTAKLSPYFAIEERFRSEMFGNGVQIRLRHGCWNFGGHPGEPITDIVISLSYPGHEPVIVIARSMQQDFDIMKCPDPDAMVTRTIKKYCEMWGLTQRPRSQP